MPGSVAGLLIIDELDGSPEQTALGVDLFDPHLMGEQHGLASRGKSTGQRQTDAELDRIGGKG
jgi:hypothetical protein